MMPLFSLILPLSLIILHTHSNTTPSSLPWGQRSLLPHFSHRIPRESGLTMHICRCRCRHAIIADDDDIISPLMAFISRCRRHFIFDIDFFRSSFSSLLLYFIDAIFYWYYFITDDIIFYQYHFTFNTFTCIISFLFIFRCHWAFID